MLNRDKKKTSNIKTYGFSAIIPSTNLAPGINEHTIFLISKKKNDPIFLTNWRLDSYNTWLTMSEPNWSELVYTKIDYNKIIYYSAPNLLPQQKNNKKEKNSVLNIYKNLNVDVTEKKKNTLAIDAVFDSVSIITTFQNQLLLLGVIFCSFSTATLKYPALIKKYLGSVVRNTDNFFAALNSAVFSDGSFCYIPKYTICPIDLSTYFRINTVLVGQFERTLIVADEFSKVNYLEGCTAPIRNEHQLHAAVVEIIALKKSEVQYSTVQNWYPGNYLGVGGIFNFVTKRGLCWGNSSKISWIQIEIGSSKTWKYPSLILKGKKSHGEFYSVAFTKHYQQTDTGTKVFHLGQKTKSTIYSKSIVNNMSKNIFRSFVMNSKNINNVMVYSQCDSLLMTKNCISQTKPEFQIKGHSNTIMHEALTGQLDYKKMFYCMQRGLNEKNSIILLVNGFCNEILHKLPMEFSIEIYKLIKTSLE